MLSKARIDLAVILALVAVALHTWIDRGIPLGSDLQGVDRYVYRFPQSQILGCIMGPIVPEPDLRRVVPALREEIPKLEALFALGGHPQARVHLRGPDTFVVEIPLD